MSPYTKTQNIARHSQRGLSLIELMISITIGLLILSAMATLFANQSRTRSELDKSNRMIDNGRYSLEVLSGNLRLAGFYGTLNPSTVALPGAIPDPCSTTMANIAAAIPLHVQGYDAASAGADIASPPSCVPATLKTGSDIFVIRRVDTSDAVAQTAAVSGTPYLQASQCQYDSSATLYKVDSTPANFTLRQKNCTTGSTTPYAELRRMMVQIYFVDSENETGDGIPTLKRIELNEAGAMVEVPLVEGIEFMQVDYGLDATADGAADSYTDCSACTVADWSNIVSVKISVIARNIETSAGYTDTKTYSLGIDGTYTPAAGDHYKRHAYTQVVRLVNPSGRRE
jgi:type IV pilus assembly protein PilW